MGRARLIRVDAPPAAADEELLAFVEVHPADRIDVALARFIIARRVGARADILDVSADDARVALAALVEHNDGTELILLGADAARLEEVAVHALLDHAEPRAARALDLPLLPDRLAWRPLLEARGWRAAHTLQTLVRSGAAAPPRAPALPPGWRWMGLTPARTDEHRQLLVAAFAAQPGAFIPSPAELLAHARGTSLLVGDGRELAFASVRVDGPIGYVTGLGRDPARRGHGLGDHALARALALLHGRNVARIELEVGADNTGALALYHRHGFTSTRATIVMRRAPGHDAA